MLAIGYPAGGRPNDKSVCPLRRLVGGKLRQFPAVSYVPVRWVALLSAAVEKFIKMEYALKAAAMGNEPRTFEDN